MRDRITEFRRVRAGEITGASWNWRKHPRNQRDAVSASIEDLGFFSPLEVRQTEHGLEIIDGHLRQDIIQADISPDTLIPVVILDFDEAEAKKANLIKDPLASLAMADQAALERLMDEVSIEDDALATMLAELSGVDADPLIEGWGETPENKNGTPKSVVAYLGIYIAEVENFETLLGATALPGERQIDTIMRGLNAIHPEGQKREREVPQ